MADGFTVRVSTRQKSIGTDPLHEHGRTSELSYLTDWMPALHEIDADLAVRKTNLKKYLIYGSAQVHFII